MNSDLMADLIGIANFKIPINISKEEKEAVYENLGTTQIYKEVKSKKSDSSVNNKKDSFNDKVRSLKSNVPLHWKTEEELVKRITAIINKISKRHIGMDLCMGYDKYDVKKISKLIVSKRIHQINNAKYSKKAKHIEFFIDTSMSMEEYRSSITEAIRILERDGFICYIRGCGNGFSDKDRENDQYNVRHTLESIEAGIIPTICRPTEETASKLANKAEFSIVISDFDGLSSIVRMSKMCNKDKIPYFLSTENRYSWRNTTAHAWVEKENSMYELNRIFDIAKKRN